MPQVPSSPSNPTHFGDVGEAHNVTWAYYSDAFLASEAANCQYTGQRQFNVHEEPFAHFGAFDIASANTSAYWALHQKDTNDFFNNLNAGTLEQVTWWNAAQTHDYGLSNGDINHGNAFIDAWFANLTASAKWKAGKVMVMVTSISPSGSFDFIAPYKGDRSVALYHSASSSTAALSASANRSLASSHRSFPARVLRSFGPGLRLPFVVASPYHVSGGVNKDSYEMYSMFKMIGRRFGVADQELINLWGQARFTAARDLTASFPGSSQCISSSTGGTYSSDGAHQRSGGALLLVVLASAAGAAAAVTPALKEPIQCASTYHCFASTA